MNFESVSRGRPRIARLGPALGAMLAILLALPSLRSPLLQDDVAHRTMLEGKLPGLTWGPLELYDFVGSPTRPVTRFRDSGYMPWFVEDDLKLRFFRPLSSALVAADWHLFGDRTWASRLHSLAWFLAILGIVAAFHRRVLPPATAGLATLIYAIAAAHALPIAWIAARHALVAAAFGAASVVLHLRWREDGWSPARGLSLLTLAVGLAGGELAIGGVAIIASWELVGRRDPIDVRIRAVAPVAALAVAYLTFYVVAGYGARGGAAYIGPGSGFEGALAALRHFLVLAGELTAATPADAFGTATAAVQTGAALWGLAMVAIVWALFRTLRTHFDPRQRDAMRWLPLAAAAAAVPGALAVVGGRVLTLALVPASGAMAALLVAGASAVRDRRIQGRRRVVVAVIVGGLALAHLVSAPLVRFTVGTLLTELAVTQHRLAATTPACDGVMVIVAAADPAVALYVPATMLLQGRPLERLRVLSMAAADHRIENVTPSGFDLVMLDPARTWTLWEQVYRGAPLPAGTRVSVPSLDVVVLEDSGGIPIRVRFDFGEPLVSPHLCFYQWRDGALSRLPVPLPGDRVHLAYERGPGGT